MRSKAVFCLILALLFMASFVYSEGRREAPAAAVPDDGPQYGGTLTLLHAQSDNDPTSWDPFDSVLARVPYAHPFGEPLIMGDVINRGPRGTGEFTFQVGGYLPEYLLTGVVAESWEWQDPNTLVFKIRPGVMYYANPNWDFEAREVIAADVAFVINRFRNSSGGSTWIMWVDEAEATDKYTVVVHTNRYTSAWHTTLVENAFSLIYPPELVDAGIGNWRNQTGTGPFKLKEHVKDVKVTYEKNPDWWNRKQSINGKEYELPFIDELVYPILPDEGTQIAALRTGKADYHLVVPMVYRDTLAKTSSELLKHDYFHSTSYVVMFQWREGPFTDKRMRHAIKIGTDVQAIVNNVLIEGAVQSYPLSPALPETYYTPLEAMPQELQKLYNYNPEFARQLVKEAGHEGLEMEVYIDNTAASVDRGAMLKEMWNKIGVNVTLKVVDRVAIRSLRGSGEFKHAIIIDTGTTNPEGHLEFWIQAPFAAHSQDEWLVEQVKEVVQIMDPIERARRVKELTLYRIEEAWLVGLGLHKQMAMHWPWVKNYYGEINSTGGGLFPMIAHMWIDRT